MPKYGPHLVISNEKVYRTVNICSLRAISAPLGFYFLDKINKWKLIAIEMQWNESALKFEDQNAFKF